MVFLLLSQLLDQKLADPIIYHLSFLILQIKPLSTNLLLHFVFPSSLGQGYPLSQILC